MQKGKGIVKWYIPNTGADNAQQSLPVCISPWQFVLVQHPQAWTDVDWHQRILLATAWHVNSMTWHKTVLLCHVIS